MSFASVFNTAVCARCPNALSLCRERVRLGDICSARLSRAPRISSLAELGIRTLTHRVERVGLSLSGRGSDFLVRGF